MKQKLKNHFKKHHRKYKVLCNTLCYLVYYSSLMFIAYKLGLDLKTCVWVFFAIWLYPYAFDFEKLYAIQKAKEIKVFSESFKRGVDDKFPSFSFLENEDK